MDEIVKDFLIESNENLDRLDQELVKLESSPSSKELLASIFRTIHTIKGSCGFLGFARLEKLTHAADCCRWWMPFATFWPSSKTPAATATMIVPN